MAVKWAEDEDRELGFERGKSELLIDMHMLVVSRTLNSSSEGEG